MGIGASNQVRSRIDSASEAVYPTTGCSSKVEATKTLENNNIFSTTTHNSNKSEAIPHQSLKIYEREKPSKQKPEIILPNLSNHGKKSSQLEIEGASKNRTNHDLHKKIRELELALAVSESHQLDLQDQLQALEDKNKLSPDQSVPALMNNSITLNEIINAKDQHIKKLEEDLKSAQMEFKNKALKFKRRIRGLKQQIFELRQEAFINKMEEKTKLSPKIDHAEGLNTQVSTAVKDISLEGTTPNTSHTKLIVELSSQISEQEEHIVQLTAEVVEKNQRIEQLEAALGEMRNIISSPVSTSQYSETLSNSSITTISRTVPSKGEKNENAFNYSMQIPSGESNINGRSSYTKSKNNSLTGAHHRKNFEYPSTALSGSDSDWEEGPKVHRHGAPADGRSRRKLPALFSRNIEDSRR